MVNIQYSIRKQHIQQNFKVYLQDELIKNVTEFMCLGLFLDPHPKLKKHIHNIAKSFCNLCFLKLFLNASIR